MSAPAVATQPTVFIVDDDPDVRKALRWLVESVGLHVQTFGSGQEFLAAFDPRRTGCIVTDVRMPGMGGLDMQERLRELGCRLPLIVMTAYGDVGMAVRAMKNGAVHLFEKPINNQTLLDQIQDCIAQDARRVQEEAHRTVVEERYRKLTSREFEVLEEVVEGFSSKEIGQHLNVSFKTIEAHRAKIMVKMKADSVPHLIRMYLELPAGVRNRQPPPPAGETSPKEG